MKEKINKLTSHALSSLYLCNKAFNEIWNITQAPSTSEELKLVSSPPFNFYSVALQYCFIMEYSKLLDTNLSHEDKNVASLFKLNNSANEFLGEEFKIKYIENKKLLNELNKSDLGAKLKKLRDKKFGHADNDESINIPLKIEGFSSDQITEIKNHLRVLLRIVNNILVYVAKSSFGLNDDNRTANFIRHHAKYKQYYYDNYKRAMEEGYGLNVIS